MPDGTELRRFESEKDFEESVKYELQNPRFRYYLLAGKDSGWSYISGVEYSSDLSMQFYPVVSRARGLIRSTGLNFLLNQRIIEERDEIKNERNLAQERVSALARSLCAEVQKLGMQDLSHARVFFDTFRPECSLGLRPLSKEAAKKGFASFHAILATCSS
jgi:hypothetical protein